MKKYPVNPVVAVGAVVFKDQNVLLIKRSQEPAKGQWSIPGGKVKIGETLQEAAEREILEETGIVIKANEPVHSFDIIEKDLDSRVCFHYVIIDFLANYVSGEPVPGDDAISARWVGFQEIEKYHVNRTSRELIEKLISSK